MQLERAFAWSALSQLGKGRLLSYIMNIAASDAEAYLLLVERPSTVRELATSILKERSIAQRVLKRLVDAGLAQRVSKPAKRGRRFEYEALPLFEAKRKMLERLDVWHGAMRERVQEL